jgi:hypothetical protein
MASSPLRFTFPIRLRSFDYSSSNSESLSASVGSNGAATLPPSQPTPFTAFFQPGPSSLFSRLSTSFSPSLHESTFTMVLDIEKYYALNKKVSIYRFMLSSIPPLLDYPLEIDGCRRCFILL